MDTKCRDIDASLGSVACESRYVRVLALRYAIACALAWVVAGADAVASAAPERELRQLNVAVSVPGAKRGCGKPLPRLLAEELERFGVRATYGKSVAAARKGLHGAMTASAIGEVGRILRAEYVLHVISVPSRTWCYARAELVEAASGHVRWSGEARYLARDAEAPARQLAGRAMLDLFGNRPAVARASGDQDSAMAERVSVGRRSVVRPSDDDGARSRDDAAITDAQGNRRAIVKPTLDEPSRGESSAVASHGETSKGRRARPSFAGASDEDASKSDTARSTAASRSASSRSEPLRDESSLGDSSRTDSARNDSRNGSSRSDSSRSDSSRDESLLGDSSRSGSSRDASLESSRSDASHGSSRSEPSRSDAHSTSPSESIAHSTSRGDAAIAEPSNTRRVIVTPGSEPALRSGAGDTAFAEPSRDDPAFGEPPLADPETDEPSPLQLRGLLSVANTLERQPALDSIDFNRRHAQGFATFRAMARLEAGTVAELEAHFLQTLAISTTGNGPFGAAHNIDANRFAGLEYSFASSENASAALTVDRLKFRLSVPKIDLTLGRQPINLATTYYFTPNDFFIPFSADTTYRVYKPGVDAGRLDVQLGELSTFSVISVLGYDHHPFNGAKANDPVTWDRSALLLTSSFSISTFHFSALAGKIPHALAVGGSFEGELFEALAVRAEGHFAIPSEDRQKRMELAIAVSHRFESSLELRVEHFYHGGGANSRDNFDTAIDENLGSIPFLSSQMTAFGAGYEITPLLKVETLAVVSWADRSGLASLAFTYSIFENGEVAASGRVPWGAPPSADIRDDGLIELHPASEFGSYPVGGNVDFRIFF